MDKQQHPPEKDLSGIAAIEMMQHVVQSADTCLLVTRHDRFPFDVRPMAAQEVDDSGTVWFLSASDSDKNVDLARDPRVTLLIQNSRQYEYAQISGHASIHRDRALIDRYWSKMAEAWFNGKDDPRITLIAVHPESGHYWTTENGKIIASMKMLMRAAGAPVGQVGVSGELRV